ncbi:MAG: ComF family protein [Clostridia bacterium]|nr:ComF family protein [Clostridia bacterium]
MTQLRKGVRDLHTDYPSDGSFLMHPISEFIKIMSSQVLVSLYPSNIYCMCCGDTIDRTRIHGLCDQCRKVIPWEIENPFASYMEEFSFDDVWPVARYGFYVRGMLYNLKLYGKTYMARNMGLLLAERVLLEHKIIDALVAVPLFKAKENKRGYNQAGLLAEYASKEISVPFWKEALEKVCETGSVRMSDSFTRRSMLVDAFAVAPGYMDQIKNKVLLLVDDVCTTGSTADACARVLKEAGAQSVILLCFASASGYRKFE